MITIIGVIGMAIILLAFFMNQTHRWHSESPMYDFANFVGAAVLTVYSWMIASWPFFILNVLWAIVSLIELERDIKVKRTKKPRKIRGHIGHKRK